VTVTWDDGRLQGDGDVVSYLLAQEQCGEPIGVQDGRVVEASFRSRAEALDSLFSLIGPFSAVRGDLGGASPEDFMAEDLPTPVRRSGCLMVGGFWIAMVVLLWVPPLFALTWAVIGLIFVGRPVQVTRRVNASSTSSDRWAFLRIATAPWRSPLIIRLTGLAILIVVAVGVLAEVGAIGTE